MTAKVFQCSKNKWHWELLSSNNNPIDGNKIPYTQKRNAINEAQTIMAAHGIVNYRVIEETEKHEPKYHHEESTDLL